MRNIIEELYYGNICPMDRQIVKGGRYSHLLHLVTRNEENLMGTLTQAQQETFGKYKDCVSELNEAFVSEHYILLYDKYFCRSTIPRPKHRKAVSEMPLKESQRPGTCFTGKYAGSSQTVAEPPANPPAISPGIAASVPPGCRRSPRRWNRQCR